VAARLARRVTDSANPTKAARGIEVLKMKTYVGRRTSERGAVLIQAALAVMALTAFTAFIVDYGVFWVARNQAQTAADAGALAGAVALAYDESVYPPTSGGMAEQSALKAARCASGSASCSSAPLLSNPAAVQGVVWPSQPGASSTVSVTWACPPGFTGKCLRVDVFRDGQGNGSTALPVFAAPLLGLRSQGVRATASARWAAANATNCLRPFAIPDKWTENVTAGTFDHWNTDGTEKNPHDVYIPPTQSDWTGYKYPDNVGDLVTLIPGSTNDRTIAGNGWSLMIDLPDGNGGWVTGNTNTANIATCAGHTVRTGQYLPTENGGTGQIDHYTQDLIHQDNSATWDSSNKTVISSNPNRPRVVPIAVFDVDEYQQRKVNSDRTPCSAAGIGGQCVKIVSILGFFVLDEPVNGTVRGYLYSDPGEFVAGPPIQEGASFLHIIQLVR